MGVTISLYEGGSCANVAVGESVGRFPFFNVDATERALTFGESCYTFQYALEEVFEGTNLQTNLYPDFNVIEVPEAPIDLRETLVVYSSRDTTCTPQPRIPTDEFLQSRNLEQVICQDVTNGFVLYCFNPEQDSTGRGPRSCRNLQSFVVGTWNPVPLSLAEQAVQQTKVLEDIVSEIIN